MTPDVVVDIGNTRMKWGRCRHGHDIEYVSMPSAQAQWEIVSREWKFQPPVRWAIASVNPPVLDQFKHWIGGRGDSHLVIDHFTQLPISLNVDAPERVGIDRLLDAVAAKHRLPPGKPGIVVDAGTAVTVDLIDSSGVFQGGAILPGPRLMFQALHEHTAKLPLIEEGDLEQPYPGYDDRAPGKNTKNAIVAGVIAGVEGGVEALVREMSKALPTLPVVILTGGTRLRIRNRVPNGASCEYIETLTLEGIRIAAEALP